MHLMYTVLFSCMSSKLLYLTEGHFNAYMLLILIIAQPLWGAVGS